MYDFTVCQRGSFLVWCIAVIPIEKGGNITLYPSPMSLNSSNNKKDVNMVKYQIGRSAVTGRFVPVRAAQNKPRTHVVETIKKK